MTYKGDPQECPTRLLRKSVTRVSRKRMTNKSVLQECPTRVSYKSAHKSVLQQCSARVSQKSVSYKSVTNRLSVCFRVRVCIRVRGFHLVSLCFQAFRSSLPPMALLACRLKRYCFVCLRLVWRQKLSRSAGKRNHERGDAITEAEKSGDM